MLPSEKLLFEKAIKAWGVEAQLKQLQEEIGELLSALGKFARGRVGVWSVAEEVADVEVMLDQTKIIFDCEEMSRKKRVEKIARLKRLLDRVK